MKRGVYPGTFDPVTNGHIDLIKRSLALFEEVIVAIAPSPHKHPLFNVEDRLEMIKTSVADIPRVEVEVFDGLLIDYVREKKAVAVIRGLRAVSDFEYELQMALMNRKLDAHIETVFLMPSEEYSYLTSSIIKGVAGYGGDVRELVPPVVWKYLQKNMRKKKI
ncbi:MAG: pantetheine-phosphate adenylyltransferase [Nitrospirae bacterium]|nr:pantetheine-phosphate adenylyltransferase [Nitrospirota bacterium]MBI3353187.1 pantetheine-phosphate adenylyltransferase [Nitrospirota bacterium]